MDYAESATEFTDSPYLTGEVLTRILDRTKLKFYHTR